VVSRPGAILLVTALLLAVACGPAAEIYEVGGVVEEVHPERQQVRIAHQEIPGFMPAMAMDFDLADPGLLEGLEAGQVVRFRFEHDRRSLRILAIEPVNVGEAGQSSGSDANPLRGEPAPDFRLVDQDGSPFVLSDLRGSAVLLDFVYTRCPGPCPILTGIHVELQRRLPPALRQRTHLVSVSLDPLHDTPERLRAYAKAHGADLSGWSFVTGGVEEVQSVLGGYSVGSTRAPDGEIVHTAATYLLDPEGRVARVWLGLEHEPQEIEQELARVLGAAS
jgi:protein SCO1/2